MGEKILSLVFAVAILAIGGYAIARTLHHKKSVAPAIRRAMVDAAVRKEPGAAVMSSQCDAHNCTIYVRKGATHSCDGWLASIDADGGVALVGVGKKSC